MGNHRNEALGQLVIGDNFGDETFGQLEVVDNLGDVGVHLVQLGVLGGGLPVLAARHRVHNVLGEEICRNHWEISGTSCLPG